MKKWKQIIMTIAILAGTGAAALPAADVGAIDVFKQCGSNSTSAVCGAQKDSASGMITNVINTLLYVLGMIAVIMIVIGGIRYTTSNGDSSSTKAAKDTVLYSVVGLIIAMLSFAIVNFVVGRF
ncbi:MAG TPA: hypothetical protein VK502_02275 [Candidatus Saccharimonadales bacterium]|nr:hypothetical protein [Candidatus Saccharimonadales bacterium]